MAIAIVALARAGDVVTMENPPIPLPTDESEEDAAQKRWK